ncbi:MAG TPA: RDD family protein, partial [bacterium]|nr:RDD family protein [bacterium]
MAVPWPSAAPRAYFCPQCGQAVRPTGPGCPRCGAAIALPPPLAQRLRSEAETLAPVAYVEAPRDPWGPAPITARFGAHVIDLSIVSAFTFPLLVVFYRHLEAVPLAFMALLIVWQLLFPPLFGGTPGMRVMGLFLVNSQGLKPDVVQAALRVVGYLFAVLTFGLSLLARYYRPD